MKIILTSLLMFIAGSALAVEPTNTTVKSALPLLSVQGWDFEAIEPVSHDDHAETPAIEPLNMDNLICVDGVCYTPEAWALYQAQKNQWNGGGQFVAGSNCGNLRMTAGSNCGNRMTTFYVPQTFVTNSNCGNRINGINRLGLNNRVVTRYRTQRVKVACPTCPSGWKWETRQVPFTANIMTPASAYRARWSVQGGNQNISRHMQEHHALGHYGGNGDLFEQHDAIHDQIGGGYIANGQFVSTGGGASGCPTCPSGVYGNPSFQVNTFRGPVSFQRGRPVRNMAARLFPGIAKRRGW